ncbi:MAG: hypothetical protein ACO1RX_16625 [Candidatus Sericytochromatia bacterium]
MTESTLSQLPGALSLACGTYSGRGSNHSGEAFAGTLVLEPVLAGQGFQLRYLATGRDGSLLHAEHSLLAPDANGLWCLWNFNTNSPGLLCHRLVNWQPERGLAEFVLGDLNDPTQFREQITLRLENGGSLSYTYAWGQPGGDFAERSGLTLTRG